MIICEADEQIFILSDEIVDHIYSFFPPSNDRDEATACGGDFESVYPTRRRRHNFASRHRRTASTFAAQQTQIAAKRRAAVPYDFSESGETSAVWKASCLVFFMAEQADLGGHSC
jgi:hypothetical protein